MKFPAGVENLRGRRRVRLSFRPDVRGNYAPETKYLDRPVTDAGKRRNGGACSINSPRGGARYLNTRPRIIRILLSIRSIVLRHSRTRTIVINYQRKRDMKSGETNERPRAVPFPSTGREC